MGFRVGRTSEDLKRELTDIIRHVKDPRVSSILTIIKVELSNDLSHCKVYISSLEGMDKVLAKFHKMGILSMQSLNEYFDDVLSVDKKIKNILEEIGLSRHVNQFDRDKYKIWTESWHLPDDVIEYASTIAKGKDQPMQYLATILSFPPIITILIWNRSFLVSFF